jgi:uncharacterized delta-60 repeat protein
MRPASIALCAALAACSSSSTSHVLRDTPEGGDGGNPTDGNGLGDRGSTGDVVGDRETGGDADAGDSSVTSFPVVFDPASVELRAGASVPVRVRLRPGATLQGMLAVTLALEGPDGGTAPLSLSRSSLSITSTAPEASFDLSATAGAAQGAYAIRASATVGGGNDPPAITSLPVSVIGRPGELDTSFGNGGYIDYQPEGNCNAEAVLALPDGRFVIFGQALTSNLLIARFRADGMIDDTFGPSGNGRLVLARGFGRPTAALLPDGRMLVAFDSNNQITVLRALENGVPDGSFGTGGFVPVSLSPGNHTGFGVAPDGKMLIGGDFFDETDRASRGAVMRLTPAGALDTAGFAGGGTVEVGFGQMPGLSEGSSGVEALALQSNGNIVAVGGYHALPDSVPTGGDQLFVFRVQSNGQPDGTFGPGGSRATKIGANAFGNYESGMAVVVQKLGANAGKVVAAGYYRQDADTAYLLSLVRHGSSGALDPSLAGSGKATYNLPDNVEDFPGEMLLEPDDGLLIQVHSGQATRMMVARFSADGARDAAWGDGGVTTAVAGRAFGMAQSGRHLLVVGSAQPSPEPTQSIRIARFWLR